MNIRRSGVCRSEEGANGELPYD
ncbi:hypothetical protein R3I94_004650 [Phoxinus phoxinus]